MFCFKDCNVKAGKHQADFKKTSSAESRRCCRLASAASNQKAAREHTAQTTADCKLNTCVLRLRDRSYRGVNICHSNRETETKINEKRKYTKRKQSSARLLFWISVMLITFIILSSSCCYHTCKLTRGIPPKNFFFANLTCKWSVLVHSDNKIKEKDNICFK